MDAGAFLRQLVMRMENLNVLYCGGRPDPVDWIRKALPHVRLRSERTHGVKARMPSRRGQDLNVGGLVGEFELEGDLAPFAPYLACISAIGVGKKTTRGCGECHVELG